MALESLSCEKDKHIKSPKLLALEETDVEDVKDFIEKSARLKRQGEGRQGDDYLNNFIGGGSPTTQRGDIPSSGIETCDGMNF